MTSPLLFVIAGVNGAGKAPLRARSSAGAISTISTLMKPRGESAKSWAVRSPKRTRTRGPEGRQLLETAIRDRANHAFETTLGGTTMSRLIAVAASTGFDVRVWFVGLATIEQHIARVQARVARGGHDIPHEKIRERWNASRRNLINLMPILTELRIFDNSEERDVNSGRIPPPRLLLHWKRGDIIEPTTLSAFESPPDWAKPIVAHALQLARQK